VVTLPIKKPLKYDLDGVSPCFVYLTYPEDPTTSVIVNFQLAGGIPNGAIPPIVFFDNISHNALDLFPQNPYRFHCEGRAFLYETLDITRGIFYVQLPNLNPNTGNTYTHGRYQ
jgi:hypothetical protein